jgi:hypothetical protein
MNAKLLARSFSLVRVVSEQQLISFESVDDSRPGPSTLLLVSAVRDGIVSTLMVLCRTPV